MEELIFKEIKLLSRSVEIVDKNGIGRTYVLPILTIYLFPDSKFDINNPLFLTKQQRIAGYRIDSFAGEAQGVTYIDSKIVIIENQDCILLKTIN